jgi:hypothetical protein
MVVLNYLIFDFVLFNWYISILTCFQAPWGEKRNSVHDAVCGSRSCRQNKDFKTILMFIFSYTVLY